MILEFRYAANKVKLLSQKPMFYTVLCIQRLSSILKPLHTTPMDVKYSRVCTLPDIVVLLTVLLIK